MQLDIALEDVRTARLFHLWFVLVATDAVLIICHCFRVKNTLKMESGMLLAGNESFVTIICKCYFSHLRSRY